MTLDTDLWTDDVRAEWERSMTFAVGVFDGHGTVLFANRAMRALLSLPPDSCDATDHFRAPPFSRFAEAPESKEPVFAGRLTLGGGAGVGVTLEGHAFHRNAQVLIVCEQNMRELEHSNRELASLVEEISGLRRDLLKQKRNLTEATVRLSEMNRDKDLWLGTVAHDLRTPLSTIQMLSQIIGTPGLDRARSSTAVGTIQRALKTMLGLIDSLLDASAIERGALKLRPTDVAVEALVDAVLELNQPIAAAKGIALVSQLDPAAQHGWFDPNRIEQVLNNLISNALKFSPPKTRVTLGARRKEAMLEFWVEDQGMGIRSSEIGAAFEEFSQTSTRPTAGERSTGLGLAICKRIVSQHGGSMSVQSEPGRGSCFHFTLRSEAPQCPMIG
jgi:signal transduction histidine kinase